MSTKSHPGDGSHGRGVKGVASHRRGRTSLLRSLVTGLAGLLGVSADIGH